LIWFPGGANLRVKNYLRNFLSMIAGK